ncbi:MAG: HU family DNA-binding protein [Candidatus Midichloria sp.]|uniref:HU family DNA-binding protein n=1 Tax=Hyalomma marginatum TaxID=34627 RepID=A0A8S4BU59_9ACAR|nr:HU family DNA-binding protein [Candidatus Midichloria sp.]CAG7590517.1 HU family DNA-binding protein [Hyalomma marginatum]CAG7592502.1 HU family DNA-binding protein [Hyalomma marginatum]
MNKAELVMILASYTELKKSEVNKCIESFIAIIKKALRSGEKVKLIGFGSLKIINIPSREVTDPRNGKRIKVPASKKLKFIPGKELKSILKQD